MCAEVKSKESSKELSDGDRLIILFRHGIAEDPSEGKPDHERSLTSEGNARMKEIAKGLARMVKKADMIYSSPLVRAVQTALWLSKGFGGKVRLETIDALTPEAGPEQLARLLDEAEGKTLICVGHEPNLSRNFRKLIGATPRVRVELKKGGCYGVRIPAGGKARLEWMLTPRVLRRLAD